MSILTDPTPPTDAEKEASYLKDDVRQVTKLMIVRWESGFDRIWGADNPQDIFDALGTDAEEVLEISNATVAMFADILPTRLPDEWARINDKVTTMRGDFVLNGDGTVTVV